MCAAAVFAITSLSARERDRNEVAQSAIARARDNRGVWAITDTNDLKHIKSGMECTTADGNALQFRRIVTPRTVRPQGDEVSCLYEDPNGRNRMEVHAIRADAGETSDSAFDKARKRFLSDFVRASKPMPIKPAVIPGLKIPNPTLQRTDAFIAVCGGGGGAIGVCYTTVTVSLVDGWVVDVSAEFSLAPPQNVGLGQIMATTQSMGAWRTAVQTISGNRSPWNEAIIDPPAATSDAAP